MNRVVLDVPTLPIYLIHYDQPAWCASAAENLRQSVGIEADVTVVDNGQRSGRPLADQIGSSARIVRLSSNRGYTGAANAALRDWMSRFPTGEYCVVGSHDLHVAPDALAALIELADRRPDAGILAPALVAPEPAAGGIWLGHASRQYPPDGSTEVVHAEWASGTCLLLRRRCVEEIGPFDERLGSYCEDVDYGLRASQRGWAVLVLTTAHAWGLGSSSSDVWGLRAANTVLLNAKLSGLGAALFSFADFTRTVARGFAASLLPWRERDRRESARSIATSRATALLRLITTGSLVRMIRDSSDARW